MSAASPLAKNLVLSGTLAGFVVGAYTYTMRAVGRDDLDVAIARREAVAVPPPAAAPAAPAAKR